MPGPNVLKQQGGGRFHTRWITRGKTLDLDLPIKPGPYAILNDSFRSLLAAGIGLLIAIQSLLIMAGVLKLIPLTGVTLPFVSYGARLCR